MIKTFDRTFWRIFIPFIVVIFVILFFPYWFTQFQLLDFGFSEKPGEIGDTIGGTMGPFVAIAAAVLTFFAFWVQFKANEQQKSDLKIERFENKFYESLRLHRANVEEMSISQRIYGRKCFFALFNELRICHMIIAEQLKVASKEEKEIIENSNVNTLKLAYTIFFYGIGVNSEKQYFGNLNEGEKLLFQFSKKIMLNLQDKYQELKEANPKLNYYTFDVPLTGIPDDRSKRFYYQPFDGHAELLGHYYRNLFQTTKYIVNQEGKEFPYEVKYSYVKTLRAQLSNHEQLMLYYNSVSWFEEEWKEFFIDYRLIKNLPLKLADFGVRPEEKFKNEIIRLRSQGIEMFELHE
jgi:hypothetical protein